MRDTVDRLEDTDASRESWTEFGKLMGWKLHGWTFDARASFHGVNDPHRDIFEVTAHQRKGIERALATAHKDGRAAGRAPKVPTPNGYARAEAQRYVGGACSIVPGTQTKWTGMDWVRQENAMACYGIEMLKYEREACAQIADAQALDGAAKLIRDRSALG